MTSATEACLPSPYIDDTKQHGHEDERAGLLQDSCELAVHLCQESTGVSSFCRVSFNHCAHHRRDQRCADAMTHHIANTNGGCVVVKPRDVKEIAAHQRSRQITMTKAK